MKPAAGTSKDIPSRRLFCVQKQRSLPSNYGKSSIRGRE